MTPGLVIGRPAIAHVANPKIVSFATRSGMHKQGAPTVDTTGHTSHHRVEVVVDSASEIRARYGFWQWMSDPLVTGTLLIDAAIVFGSTITPLTFGGQSTLQVAANGVAVPYVDSDIIPGLTLARGDKPFVRSFCRALAGTADFGATWYSDSGSLSWYQAGNHLSDPVASAPAAPGPAYSNTYYCSPIALLGRQSTPLPSFLCFGDSNMANSDQFSWYERALAKRYPYMRLNSAGAGLGRGTPPNVVAQADGNTHAIIAMGTNNFGSAIGVNLPLLLADIAAYRAKGVNRILVCTLPPSTISTDNWATAVNQTPTDGNATQSQNRTDLNAAIRAMAASPGGQNADAVFDAASYVEVASNNLFTIDGQRWRVNGGVPFGTGPHYSDSGMAAAAVGGATAIDRIVAGETGFMQQNPALGT